MGINILENTKYFLIKKEFVELNRIGIKGIRYQEDTV